MSIAVIEYSDLVAGGETAQAAILKAFGDTPECLGIILVRGVPGYQDLRKRLLPLSNKLVRLPKESLDELVREDTHYFFGWSHGKEKFGGKFDTAKGSFYANPQMDIKSEDPELIRQHAGYLSPNVWPNKGLPELEGAFKDLGCLIVEVGKVVAKACDQYVSERQPNYTKNALENLISTTLCTKGRLLHYFPLGSDLDSEGSKKNQDSWCGWHVDHCALTGLTSAMYFDGNQHETPCPDPNAGLYIRSRGGEVHRAPIPSDCLAFQMGEVAQIISGGLLRATYHCVRAAYGPGTSDLARSTLAIFMQPDYDFKLALPAGVDPKTVDVVAWKSSEQTFSDFSNEKAKEYY